ncbi:MAG: M23 family metallopeptidase [Thermotaleaceae bacterium]
MIKKLKWIIALGVMPFFMVGAITAIILMAIASANGVTPEEIAMSHNMFHGTDTTFAGIPNTINQEEISIPEDKFLRPVDRRYRISSPFGWRIHPIYKDRRFHHGIDLAAPQNTPVYAAAPGEVIFAARKGEYGNLIIIEHSDYGYENFQTYYAHLSSIGVRKGEIVEMGQGIGRVGSTGASTGPHLHFEIRFKYQTVDPIQLLAY